jgi:probable phosphoglycerate mutase
MRLLLIRHGQTPANVLGQLDTAAPGPGLTELGARQAAAIPHALRDEPVDAIFASTLVRTQLTANPLADDRDLDVRVLQGLHEIEAGSLESRSDRAAARAYLETAFAWGSGNLDVRMPGGQDGHSFFERFDTDIQMVAEVAGTAAVFSHGAAIRVWTAGRAHNIPASFAGTNELDNTGVVELSGSPDEGWTLLSWAGIPVGGADLVGAAAEDPTGESLDELRD